MRDSASFDPAYANSLRQSLVNDNAALFGLTPTSPMVDQPEAQVPESVNLVVPEPEETETSLVRDVTDFFKEFPRNALGGVGDAVRTAADIIRPYVPEGAIQVIAPDGSLDIKYLNEQELNEMGGLPSNIVFNEDKPESTGGEIVRTLSRFMAGYLPISSVLGAMGVAGNAARGVLGGAVAEGIVMDPHQARLSTILNEIPGLKEFIPDYLANGADETETEGRLKNLFEGLSLGAMVEGATKGTMSIFRRYREKLPKSEKIVQALKEGKEIPETELVKETATPMPKEFKVDEAAFPEDFLSKQPDGSVYLNTNRIDTIDDVKKLLRVTAEAEKETVTKGTTTFKQIIEDSSKEYQDIYSLLNRPPTPMTAPEALAARNILTSSANNLHRLAVEATGLGATAEAKYEFRKALAVHNSIQEVYYAGRKATAQSLASWRIMSTDEGLRTKAINEMISNAATSGTSIDDMAQAIVDVGANGGNVSATADNLTRASFADAFYEVWINGILSGLPTHVANIVSNTATTMMAIPERFITAAYDKFFAGNNVAFQEAGARAYGMAMGIKDAISLLGKQGADMPAELSKYTVISEAVRGGSRAIAPQSFGIPPENVFGRGLDYLGRIIGLPTWALNKSDIFFKGINYRMQLQEEAVKVALGEKLTGKAFSSRVAELVNNPTEAMKGVSADFARYQTFTDPANSGFVKGLQQAFSSIPGGRYILPFVRTPANILYYGFERTPLAPLHSAIRAELSAGGTRAATAAAKISAGSLLMAGVIPYVLSGTITGGGPTDKEAKRSLLQTGWQPYSIKIGNTYYSYNRMEPIGTLLGYSADIVSMRGNVDDETSASLVSAGLSAFFKSLSNKTFVSGAVGLMSTIDSGEPRKFESWAARFGSTLASPIYSGFNKRMNAYFDPPKRDFNIDNNEFGFLRILIERAKENSAGWAFTPIDGPSEEVLPSLRDIWGESLLEFQGAPGIKTFLENQSPIKISDIKTDPLSRMIFDEKLVVNFPDRNIMGVRLTNNEYSEYSRLAGQFAKKSLSSMYKTGIFEKLSGGTDGQKGIVVNQVLEASRKRARGLMMRDERFDLIDRIREKKKEKANGANSR